LPRRELPFPTAAGVVRIEGTDTTARQDAFSRIPSFLDYAGEKVRMGDKMRVERSLIDDLATRDR